MYLGFNAIIKKLFLSFDDSRELVDLRMLGIPRKQVQAFLQYSVQVVWHKVEEAYLNSHCEIRVPFFFFYACLLFL